MMQIIQKISTFQSKTRDAIIKVKKENHKHQIGISDIKNSTMNNNSVVLMTNYKKRQLLESRLDTQMKLKIKCSKHT